MITSSALFEVKSTRSFPVDRAKAEDTLAGSTKKRTPHSPLCSCQDHFAWSSMDKMETERYLRRRSAR